MYSVVIRNKMGQFQSADMGVWAQAMNINSYYFRSTLGDTFVRLHYVLVSFRNVCFYWEHSWPVFCSTKSWYCRGLRIQRRPHTSKAEYIIEGLKFNNVNESWMISLILHNPLVININIFKIITSSPTPGHRIKRRII